jgi:coenzyme PQQ precursor peptide PqqA
MKMKQLVIAGCSILVLSTGAALAGPCDTGRSAGLKDAGSGPAKTGDSQTTGTAATTGQHPPTGAMNRTTGDVAASSQDTQRQMQGEPTAAQQSEGAKANSKTADKDCWSCDAKAMTKFRRFGRRSGIATEVFVCDGRLRQATEFATPWPTRHMRRSVAFTCSLCPRVKWLWPRGKFLASEASVCRQHRMFRACATFEVNLVLMPVRTSCQHCLGETLMSWKTPKIVEVPVGMEINMYACAARQ